ncbi:serine/threonine-protein kinase [Mucilaginibacter sp. L3T2-6]|uniref:serine/threonine protein kinase n=1 Tax=Mucilaginibacter sp. L3T2-6 TaxID=3062491 RepID=UPI0026758A6E|nr:serine/threonine-protein kinase [Mucilaginibacter sp. L3T2-6]MDO3642632.1 serine/threonine-protein kinase [Mucilaginibacter sp. L3T2-6]MDV6214972.1 serine/threonine-protein kinase [Mucilaginibacter sp. L3T2-6]
MKNILPGPVFEQQYQNLIFHRKGGMGEIFLADDVVNKQKVAIKIIAVNDASERELLKQEFEISLKLKHEHVVETFYVANFCLNDTEFVYAAMEFIQTGNFRETLRKSSKIELRDSVSYMRQLAVGLSYAHKFAIHRDLKPENVLNDNGRLLICDFGLSKYVDSKTRSRTLKGSGTVPYMAPETWTFDHNSKAMDFYSLGIMYFEILALERPFKGPSESDYKDQHLFQSLPPLSNYRSDIPVRLVEMIHKLTSKRAVDRYQNAEELITILDSISTSEPSLKAKSLTNVLLKAQQKVTEIDQKTLQLEKEQKLRHEKAQLINFSKRQLLEKFINRINELNTELEREKIKFYNAGSNRLDISFLDNKATISFYGDNSVAEYLAENKKTFFQRQNERYGFIIEEYKKRYLEIERVELIGKAEIISHGGERWGYNLLLKKDSEEDLYGDWSIVWFNDNGLNRNYRPWQYAIDVPDFFQEYEFGREHVMHVRTMSTSDLDEGSIDMLIEKLVE